MPIHNPESEKSEQRLLNQAKARKEKEQANELATFTGEDEGFRAHLPGVEIRQPNFDLPPSTHEGLSYPLSEKEIADLKPGDVINNFPFLNMIASLEKAKRAWAGPIVKRSAQQIGDALEAKIVIEEVDYQEKKLIVHAIFPDTKQLKAIEAWGTEVEAFTMSFENLKGGILGGITRAIRGMLK